MTKNTLLFPFAGAVDKYPPCRMLLGWILSAAAAFCSAGCGAEPYGKMYLRPIAQPDQLMMQDYTQAFSRLDERGQVTCVFGTEENQPAEAGGRRVKHTLVLRTFWLSRSLPKTGQLSCTNMNADLLWEVDGQMALYRGAGYAAVKKNKSGSHLTITIRTASLKLVSRTSGFSPLFQEANLSGKAVTVHNPAVVNERLDECEKKRKMLETIGLSQ